VDETALEMKTNMPTDIEALTFLKIAEKAGAYDLPHCCGVPFEPQPVEEWPEELRALLREPVERLAQSDAGAAVA
jgi:hypothetical protein